MSRPGPPVVHLAEALSAYLDDELAPAARREADAHLAGCSDCRAELGDIDEVRRAMRALPVRVAPRPFLTGRPGPGPEPPVLPFPAGEAPATVAAARRRRVRRTLWALGAAAAAAVALVLPGDRGVAPSLPSLTDSHAARASISGDPLSQLAPIAVPVRFGP